MRLISKDLNINMMVMNINVKRTRGYIVEWRRNICRWWDNEKGKTLETWSDLVEKKMESLKMVMNINLKRTRGYIVGRRRNKMLYCQQGPWHQHMVTNINLRRTRGYIVRWRRNTCRWWHNGKGQDIRNMEL